MDRTGTHVYQEHDLEIGECRVFDFGSGKIVVGIRDIGVDDQGEPVVEFVLIADPGVACFVDGRSRDTSGLPTCKGLPRLWLLLGYLLSHRVRNQLFLPMFNEFLEDYLFTRKKIRRLRDRQILAVVFTFRTFVMLWQCLLEGIKSTRLPRKTVHFDQPLSN